MSYSNFAWTFPSYILATRFNTDSGGNVILDQDIRFKTIEMGIDLVPHIAIFTDAAGADEFKLAMAPEMDFRLLEFKRPLPLENFLRKASASFNYVVFDPRPILGHSSRILPIQEAIDFLIKTSVDQQN